MWAGLSSKKIGDGMVEDLLLAPAGKEMINEKGSRWGLPHLYATGFGAELQHRTSGSRPQVLDSGVNLRSDPSILGFSWHCINNMHEAKLNLALPRALKAVSCLKMRLIFSPGFSLRSHSGGVSKRGCKARTMYPKPSCHSSEIEIASSRTETRVLAICGLRNCRN